MSPPMLVMIRRLPHCSYIRGRQSLCHRRPRATVAVVRRNIGEQRVVVVPHQECDRKEKSQSRIKRNQGFIVERKHLSYSRSAPVDGVEYQLLLTFY